LASLWIVSFFAWDYHAYLVCRVALGAVRAVAEGRKLRYQFENFRLDTDRPELVRAADLGPLEPKVFDLLAYLLRNRDRVAARTT
jgi:DNA-binding response OmpR family regulator